MRYHSGFFSLQGVITLVTKIRTECNLLLGFFFLLDTVKQGHKEVSKVRDGRTHLFKKKKSSS